MKKTNQDCRITHSILSLETSSHSQTAALIKRKTELRAQKVQHIKEQIEGGTYDVSAADIIRGIARSELSWLLNLPEARWQRIR